MKCISIFGASLAAAVLASSATAGDDIDCHAAGLQKARVCSFIEKLNLTAEQKEKLKTEREQGRESRKEFFSQIKQIRSQVREELLKPQPSKVTLDGYARQLADLHNKMLVAEYDHLLRVKAILTPDQFKMLLDHAGKRPEAMRKGKRARSGKGSL